MDSPEIEHPNETQPPAENLGKSFAQQQREEEEEEMRKRFPKFYKERERRQSKEDPSATQ